MPREVGRTKGGMNTKLHAICVSKGRPLHIFSTAGQVSNDIGAEALLRSIPDVEWLPGPSHRLLRKHLPFNGLQL